MDWLDLLAVQGTLKSLLQHHSSKASVLRCSIFFTVPLSHSHTTTGKTIALTRQYTSRDITLPTKVRIAKVMVFLVVMYRCESWTIKKTECWRTDAFELWCWRTLLRVSWTARRSNQSILKEINWIFTERTDAEAEALILWPPEVRADSLEKTWERLKATGEGGSRGWDD